jgi:hypothetical protein
MTGRRTWRRARLLCCAMWLAGCGGSTPPSDAPERRAAEAVRTYAAVCSAGTADCNGRADDGCESVPAEDPANCGACGVVCTVGPRALPVCIEGRCLRACRVGYGECDGDPATECEAEVLVDPCRCGGCDRACAEGEFCVAGMCQGRPDPLVRVGPPAPRDCSRR